MRKFIAALTLAFVLALASLPASAGGTDQSGGAAPTPTPCAACEGGTGAATSPEGEDSFSEWISEVIASIFG